VKRLRRCNRFILIAWLRGFWDGDVLTLVEKAQEEFDLRMPMQEKILRLSSTYRLLKQMRLLKNMGSLGGIIKMIPGMNKLSDDQLKQGETRSDLRQ